MVWEIWEFLYLVMFLEAAHLKKKVVFLVFYIGTDCNNNM